MFSDVHRHLVLCMKPLHGHKPRFRQIVVIKTDVFELRILEGEAVQLDQQAIANAVAAEIHAHEALAPAVAHAEKEYIASVGEVGARLTRQRPPLCTSLGLKLPDQRK